MRETELLLSLPVKAALAFYEIAPGRGDDIFVFLDPLGRQLGSGGGYMLILAHDTDAGQRVRARLKNNPPNSRARFVDMKVSESGFQVTRS